MPQKNINEKVLAFLQQEETDYTAAAQLGEAALPLLKSIVISNNESLASKATSLAGMIGGPGGAEVVELAAGHNSEVVRVAAASAAQQLSTDQSVLVLSKLIDDPDMGVTKLALRSMKAKNLTSRFADRIRSISDKHPQEGIQKMAKGML